MHPAGIPLDDSDPRNLLRHLSQRDVNGGGIRGARAGVRRRATVNHALQQAENVLEARGVVDGTVTIVPSNFSNLNALDEITVIVSAPISGNSFFGYNPLNPTRYASAQVVMVREFDD